MKRPLENLPPLDPAHMQALHDQLATRWFENPARALKIGFRKVSQLPLHCTQQRTEVSAMAFRDRHQVFQELGITQEGALLHSEDALYYPPEAPAIDESPYFSQWAVAWEPISTELPVPIKYDRTLIVEIGAGFHLLSLVFTPDPYARDNPQALQLDRLTLRQGHDVFELPLGITYDHDTDQQNLGRVTDIFQLARYAIATINDDYPMAEMVLSEGLRPVIEALRLPACPMRPVASHPASPARLPHDQASPGLPAPQEP